jgi:hypothetical protein
MKLKLIFLLSFYLLMNFKTYSNDKLNKVDSLFSYHFAILDSIANYNFVDNEKDKSTVNFEKDSVKRNDCGDCNIEFGKRIRLNVEKATEQDILKFLFCLNPSCFNDVEFGEFANYTLFFLMQRIPEQMLKIMDNHKQELNFNNIKNVFENPISDQIDMGETYNKIEKIKGYTKTKRSILASIKIGIEKYK